MTDTTSRLHCATRILVTGASGFIGSTLSAHLMRCGHDVLATSRRARPAGRPGRFWQVADPGDATALGHVLREYRPSVVFHLAGATVMRTEDDVVENQRIADALIEAARATGCRARLVFVGSAAEYGALGAEELPAREEGPARPCSLYGTAKLRQTERALAAARDGLDVVVARPFNVIGKGMPEHLALGRFAGAMARMPDGGGVLETGSLEGRRDFISVAETARILEILGRHPEAGGRVFNLCTGRQARLRHLVDELIRISGKRVVLNVRDDDRGVNNVDVMYGSPSRLEGIGIHVRAPDIAEELRSVWEHQAVLV